MSDFEDKLNSILSNSEAMGQIMQLARSLGGEKKENSDSGTPSSPPPASDRVAPSSEAPSFETPSSEPPVSDSDPFSALGKLDPRLLSLALKILKAYQSNDDDRAALLTALRPFVRPERYARLDQAIQISKLTRVIHIALDSFRNKEGGSDYGSHVS